MVKYWIALAMLVVAAALCLYAGTFFAWVVQTPIDAPARDQATGLLNAWMAGFVVAILLVILVGARVL
jgi:hypothetical protein